MQQGATQLLQICVNEKKNKVKSLVAQLALHSVSNGDIQDSNPPSPTIEFSKKKGKKERGQMNFCFAE
jgi:hypothetical protein